MQIKNGSFHKLLLITSVHNVQMNKTFREKNTVHPAFSALQFAKGRNTNIANQIESMWWIDVKVKFLLPER